MSVSSSVTSAAFDFWQGHLLRGRAAQLAPVLGQGRRGACKRGREAKDDGVAVG